MRLQLLYLPRRPDDTQPFALILDRCEEPLTAGELADVRAFAEQSGADGCLTTARTVDLGQDDAAEVDVTDDLSEHIAAAVRHHVQELGDMAPDRTRAGLVLTAADTPGSKAGEKVRSVWAQPAEDPRASIPGWTPEAVNA